jgi:hypothetical protein
MKKNDFQDLMFIFFTATIAIAVFTGNQISGFMGMISGVALATVLIFDFLQ